jgi:hypothetical protein
MKFLEVRRINIENLMGHSMGISDLYYRATENEFLEGFLKSDPLLTIMEKIIVLQKKQVVELKEKSKDYEYIIRSKLQTKDCIVSIHHVQRIHYKGKCLY